MRWRCLISHPVVGYPAPDPDIRDFLLQSFSDNKTKAAYSYIIFLAALLIELQSVALAWDGSKGLSVRLQELMSVGQTAERQGPARTQFYGSVKAKAEDMIKKLEQKVSEVRILY